MEHNKVKQIILEAFEKTPELSISKLVANTFIAKRTAQRYVDELIQENRLIALGQGRSRYYQRVYVNEETLTRLAVLKNGSHMGTLIFANGHYEFVYEKGYEDLLFGISSTHNSSGELYAIFENLIPEHDRRERLTRGFKELGSILVGLDNAHGDFKFIPLGELFKHKSPLEQRPSWLENKHKILGVNEYPNIIQTKVSIDEDVLNDTSSTEHSNLSGYQHKIDVDFEDNEIKESAHRAHYLLKPLNRTLTNYFEKDEANHANYYPFLALNEHLFMSFAKNELNLDVPMSGVVPAENGDFHYLVKRYDRFNNYAYSQYDMAQLLDLKSDKKYRPTTHEILSAFGSKVFNKEAKMAMLSFQIYSILIKHSDFHAKNMGILEIGKNKFIGTPLYDVISVGVYNGTADDLGLPLSKERRKRKKYTLEDMLFIANTLNVPALKSKEIIKRTIEVFLDRFPLYIEKTKELESSYYLEMQHTRIGKKRFSERLQSLYDVKLVELKKLGILQALGIVEKYGGVLKREQKSRALNHFHRHN